MTELVFGLPHNCKIGFIQFKDSTKLFCIFDFVYGRALKNLFKSEEDASRWLNLRKTNKTAHNQLIPNDYDAYDDDEVILCMDCVMANDPDYKFKTRASRSRMLITGLCYCAEEAFAQDSSEDVFFNISQQLH